MRFFPLLPGRRATPLWLALTLCATLLALCPVALAESGSAIAIPALDDAYSRTVRRLEGGKTDIDYRKFRESFLDSAQFQAASERLPERKALRTRLRELTRGSNPAEIMEVAKQMLGIDYTDMEAHKILQQACRLLGDAASQKKHHDIEFGLLNSIVRNGDGKTCGTGWPVIQVAEEYFILDMLGAKVLKQSLDPSGPCDRMEVETAQGPKTYYFNVTKVFEGYGKLGIR